MHFECPINAPDLVSLNSSMLQKWRKRLLEGFNTARLKENQKRCVSAFQQFLANNTDFRQMPESLYTQMCRVVRSKQLDKDAQNTATCILSFIRLQRRIDTLYTTRQLIDPRGTYIPLYIEHEITILKQNGCDIILPADYEAVVNESAQNSFNMIHAALIAAETPALFSQPFVNYGVNSFKRHEALHFLKKFHEADGYIPSQKASEQVFFETIQTVLGGITVWDKRHIEQILTTRQKIWNMAHKGYRTGAFMLLVDGHRLIEDVDYEPQEGLISEVLRNYFPEGFNQLMHKLACLDLTLLAYKGDIQNRERDAGRSTKRRPYIEVPFLSDTVERIGAHITHRTLAFEYIVCAEIVPHLLREHIPPFIQTIIDNLASIDITLLQGKQTRDDLIPAYERFISYSSDKKK